MGRWTVTALVINSIIGSGIFGLPSVMARQLGPASTAAWVVGAAINAVILLAFAEVASRFTGAGGAYLYARATLPRLAAILVGWLMLITRLSAVAAGANLFAIYAAEFVPAAAAGPGRALMLTAILAAFATVNYRGAAGGARLSTVFTVAKLLPLVVLIVAGALAVVTGGAPAAPAVAPPGPGLGTWLGALVLVGFAYGGYDGATLALGEARNPRRDGPFALVAAMIVLAVLYTAIQWLVNAALPDPGASARPLADAARVFLGPAGATLLAVGALISVTGLLSANFLNAPRLTYALAEHADLPAVFGRVHPRFRTPHVSLVVFAVLVWALALYGSFEWNATLSGVARLLVYGGTCLSLIVLRRADPGGAAVLIPGGNVLATLGIVLCALLAARMGRAELMVLGTVSALAVAHWLVVRGRAG